MRSGTLAALVCLVGCGGHGGNSGGGGDDDGGPDAGVITPPGTTCGAPVTAVDTSTPDHTVGDGTPASCTQDALAAAIAAGGTIVFSCGTSPTTISITTTLNLRTDVATTIDGGNLVTLDGGDQVQILNFDHDDYRVNKTVLTLQHLGIAHGHAHGTMTYAPAPSPCSQGYYDGYGGGLYFRDGVLVVIDTVFESNQAESLGPDVGGGAISLLGVLSATVANSTFHANKGANGGAIQQPQLAARRL